MGAKLGTQLSPSMTPPRTPFCKAVSKFWGSPCISGSSSNKRPVHALACHRQQLLVLRPSPESSADGYQRLSPAALNAGRRGLSLGGSASLSPFPCCSLSREIREEDSLSASYITCQEKKRRNAPSGLAPPLSICRPRWDLAYSLGDHWARLDYNSKHPTCCHGTW